MFIGRFEVDDNIKPYSLGYIRLHNICSWFTDERIEQMILPFIDSTNTVSLRALDWLVTNYAKKNNIVIAARDGFGGPPLNIHESYLNMLRVWRRSYFDPFRRGEKVYFMWARSANIEAHSAKNGAHSAKDKVEGIETKKETTIGQLNFLHWAYTNGIIEYTKLDIDNIVQDMKRSQLENKERKRLALEQGIKLKRRELSKAPSLSCVVYGTPTILCFDPENY